jgi:hypothetical protein
VQQRRPHRLENVALGSIKQAWNVIHRSSSRIAKRKKRPQIDLCFLSHNIDAIVRYLSTKYAHFYQNLYCSLGFSSPVHSTAAVFCLTSLELALHCQTARPTAVVDPQVFARCRHMPMSVLEKETVVICSPLPSQPESVKL